MYGSWSFVYSRKAFESKSFCFIVRKKPSIPPKGSVCLVFQSRHQESQSFCDHCDTINPPLFPELPDGPLLCSNCAADSVFPVYIDQGSSRMFLPTGKNLFIGSQRNTVSNPTFPSMGKTVERPATFISKLLKLWPQRIEHLLVIFPMNQRYHGKGKYKDLPLARSK